MALTIPSGIAIISQKQRRVCMVYHVMNMTNMNQQQQLVIKFDNGLFVVRS